MTTVKTEGNAPETAGNAMSDGEVLRYAAGQVEDLIELVSTRLDALEKCLDHLDGLAHQVSQKVDIIHAELERFRPVIDRYADPGRAVRQFLNGRRPDASAAKRKAP